MTNDPSPSPTLIEQSEPVVRVITDTSALDVWALIINIIVALATIAAVVVAALLGIREIQHLRVEQREREDERRARDEREVRAVAEKVTGWIEFSPRSAYETSDKWYATGYIANASESPIYDARVIEFDPETSMMSLFNVGFVPPGGKGHYHAGARTRTGDAEPITIFFRDPSERWWERDAEGRLTEYDHDHYSRSHLAPDHDHGDDPGTGKQGE